ncbi:MAG: SUMF1/EgtB/PvdO family nonheme iron enzyme [Elusimicrobiota bacterium]
MISRTPGPFIGLCLLLAASGSVNVPDAASQSLENSARTLHVSFDGEKENRGHSPTVLAPASPLYPLHAPPRWVQNKRKGDLKKVVSALPKILDSTKLHERLRGMGVDSRALILAQIYVESAFDPNAVSKATALGYLQVKPGTFQEMFDKYPDEFPKHLRRGKRLKKATMLELEPNLTAGVLYMREQFDRYKDDPDCLDKMLKAYNAGPERLTNGNPLTEETVQYPPKIKREYDKLLAFNALIIKSLPKTTSLPSTLVLADVIAPPPSSIPTPVAKLATESNLTASVPAPPPIPPAQPEDRVVVIDMATGRAAKPIKWITIEGDRFIMGSDNGPQNEKPIHAVDITTFLMSESEVTVEQYAECVLKQECTEPNSNDELCNWGKRGRRLHPVNCLDWEQAETFAKFANAGLPTEAQWEYAATSRGQNQHIYPWGPDAPTCDNNKAVIFGCGPTQTMPVCSKPAGKTKEGLCDMSGNVWEMLEDWYQDSYVGAPTNGGPRKTESPHRVMRGGSFVRHDLGFLRSSARAVGAPKDRYPYMGFRLAK